MNQEAGIVIQCKVGPATAWKLTKACRKRQGLKGVVREGKAGMRLGKADAKRGVDDAAERCLRQHKAQCRLEAGGSEVRRWLRTFSSSVLRTSEDSGPGLMLCCPCGKGQAALCKSNEMPGAVFLLLRKG